MTIVDTSTEVKIPAIVKSIAGFMIKGTRPLLCSKKPDLKVGINPPAPKSVTEAFKRAVYPFERSDGWTYGFPAPGIKYAMVEACSHCAAVKSHTKSRVFVETDDESEEYVRLLYPQMPEPYNMVVGQPRGGSVAATYARYEEWAIMFEVKYFPAYINEDDLATLLHIAGELVGIGARRVETGDNRIFGTFRLATAEDTEEILAWPKLGILEEHMPG